MGKSAIRNTQNRVAQFWATLSFITLLIAGMLYPPVGYFMLFCMIAAMAFGVVKGRSWCDWMCPRGSFFDILLAPFSRQREIPGFFSHWVFRLAWMTMLMSVLAVRLPPLWGDWYDMGRPFVTLLLVTTSVGIILGMIYHQRIWCMFCPMGSMANLLGRRKHQLLVASGCNGCGQCEKVCRMQINPGSYRDGGIVTDGDCLKCAYCIDECPQQVLRF